LALPIISSRELYGTRLATSEVLLCTCRKEPFVPAHHGSIHIHCRSLQKRHPCVKPLHGQRPTSDTLRLNGVYPCLAYSTCGMLTYETRGDSQLTTRHEDGMRGMRHSTRIKHVAHLVWLCKKVSLT
jgi:hypothetical protein